MEQVVELPSIDEVLSYMAKVGEPILETTRIRIQGTLNAYMRMWPPPGNKAVTPRKVVQILRRTAGGFCLPERRMSNKERKAFCEMNQLTRCMQDFQKRNRGRDHAGEKEGSEGENDFSEQGVGQDQQQTLAVKKTRRQLQRRRLQ